MSPWFVRSMPGPLARVRLFAVPHAGRGASLFFPWRRFLPDWIELVAVQLPGREGRFSEAALPTIDAIVSALVNEIRPRLDRPYALFGHSMGALICFELARALRRLDAPPPVAVILSGRRPPTAPDPNPPIHGLSDAQFIEAARARYDGIPQVLLDHPTFTRDLLPILRADIAASGTHVYRAEPPLGVPFLLCAGREDRQASPEAMAGWAALTTQPAQVRVFPGGHFYLLAECEFLVSTLSHDLARRLASPEGEGSGVASSLSGR
jgi:medium-chain acyl-[acyl-carrier-protein] hydrolase